MLAEADHQRLLRALEIAEVGTFDLAGGPDAVPALTDGLRAMFGFRPDEHPRVADYLARVHPDDRATVQAALDQSFETRQGYWLEFRVQRPGGTEIWLSARTQVVEDADGSGVRLLGAVADVSARKAAEARMQDSHALLRLAIQASGAGWNTWDLRTGRTEWDGRGREIMGFGDDPEGHLDAMTIDGWRRRVHPDDLPDLDRRIEECLAEGVDFSAEYRIVRPDGGIRVVNSVGRFALADDGTPASGTGLTFDVTELSETRVALVESERFLRRVLDNLVAFVGVLSPDGVLTQVDRTALTISGLQAADVVGRKFWDCAWWTWSPDVAERIRESVERAGRGETVRHDTVARIADDGRLALDLQISPLRDDTGRITHLIPSALDITARKDAEDVLRRNEAAERRDRRRAELIARMLSELEAVHTLATRSQLLVDLLVEHVTTWADVVLDGNVLASAGTEPEGPRVLIELDLGGSVEGCLRVASGPPLGGVDGVDGIAGDEEFARELAARAAVLLASARVREVEHHVAVRLQRALLPDVLEQHPGVSVAALYAAAGEVMEVGGDWYDSWLTPDGRLGLSVGDVVGHGLESAAAMGRLRAALTALGGEGLGPALLLDSLDRVAGTGGGVPFATAACAILDPGTGELQYACAGHPPPLVVTADGDPRWLDEGRSAPLTSPRRTGRTEAATVIAPGSLLVLYSDGLVERRGESVGQGLERLRRAASALGPVDPDEACRRLLAELTAAHPLRDDVVVLCARLGSRRPGPAASPP
jgi:PAS domain S-box-containing protein